MQTISTSWDDDSCNRTIDLNVTYSINGDGISIENVIPTRVVFQNQSSKSVGVHTGTGRRHLANKVDPGFLQQEIEKHQAILV